MDKTSSMRSVSGKDMQSCIDACTNCHNMCLQTAMSHCLESGGKHVEPGHFRLMIDCAQLCQSSANLQLSGSAFSAQLCEVCANVCDACADSCKGMEGMDECVRTCRSCAASCRSMSVTRH